MRRPTSLCLCLSTLLAVAAPATAQMSKTDKTLLDALMKNPEFSRLIPKGHVVKKLTREGGFSSGQLIWGEDPANLEIRPRGLKTERGINCDRTRTRTFDGEVGAQYSDIRSFTTTVGASISHQFSFETEWPFGSVGYTVTGQVSTERGRTNENGETLTFAHSYLAVADPRNYVDAQLQIIEQKIEGMPFTMKVEITGDAEISHQPAVAWLPSRDRSRAALISTGREKTASGNATRELYICRSDHADTTHPGKIVAGKCNFSYDDEEIEGESYDILSIPKGKYRWMKKNDFFKEYSETEIINGESPAVIAGQETDDADRRYEGQLIVCRGKYKKSWHPGKVVNHHCMFGWGGREIKRLGFDVLVEKPIKDEDTKTINIRLADYLPASVLNFTIEGTFDGARAMDSTIVVQDQRPVRDGDCAATPDALEQVAASDMPPQSKLAVKRQTIAPARIEARAGGNETRFYTFNTASGSAAPKLEPTATEEPIKATLLSTASLDGEVNRLDWNIRTLRRTRPFMRGADVLAVQRALTAAGWPVHQDGVFGGYTQRAVRLFQRANGLRANGVVDDATERRLGL